MRVGPGLLAPSAGTMLTQTIVSELGCSFRNRRATWVTNCLAAWLHSGQAADLHRALGLQPSSLSASSMAACLPLAFLRSQSMAALRSRFNRAPGPQALAYRASSI